jgi:branched-chain amino acid aminotransferase
MNLVCFNGDLLSANQPVLMADNRSYRYGHGLFETLRIIHGTIPFADLHFDRLLDGLSTLRISIPPTFTKSILQSQVLELCHKNSCIQSARVRLSISSGNGSLFEESGLQYLIETAPLAKPANSSVEKGILIDIYTGAQKTCDAFANLKTSSFLPYAMAAIVAKDHQWDDCLVLNTNGRLADSTTANIFLLRDNILFTPSLDEGCVNGVMRRFILESPLVRTSISSITETALSVQDLLDADEVFLTNAVQGIRWVRQFRDRHYSNKKSKEIYQVYLDAMQTIP